MTDPRGEPQPPPSGFLTTVRLDSIKNRILTLAVLATVIPALATAFLAYQQNREALVETLDRELRGVASQAAREIDLWVDERQYEVRVFTGSFEVWENIETITRGGAGAQVAEARLNDYLLGVFGRSTDYAELRVTDVDGQSLASTGDSLDDVSPPADWMTRLRRGETVVGAPSFDPGVSQISALMAVPVEAGNVRFTGIMLATLTFGTARRYLESFSPGDGGRIDLLTDDGSLIATSGAAEDVDAGRIIEELEGGGPVHFVDAAGTEMVGVLTPVPGLDWLVAAQTPTAEAYAEIDELRNSSFLLVSLLLLVVGAVAYLLGVVIVRPLDRLTAGAGAVAGGDLSVDLPVTGRGEVAYLTQVFNQMVGRLRRSHHELDQRNRELERLSVTDLLTGLHNRRFLLEAFDLEIRRSDRNERPFCVLMIDVDRFKQYNDTYGHPAGDEVLTAMGRVLRSAIRDLDVAARFGGEEFLVLLPECDLENAIVAGERIRSHLAEETFEGGPVTISVGVAEFPMHGETSAEVIAEADAALYEAKRKGRDRVEGAPPRAKEETERKTKKRTKSARQNRASDSA